jgi:hypothetical protein
VKYTHLLEWGKRRPDDLVVVLSPGVVGLYYSAGRNEGIALSQEEPVIVADVCVKAAYPFHLGAAAWTVWRIHRDRARQLAKLFLAW